MRDYMAVGPDGNAVKVKKVGAKKAMPASMTELLEASRRDTEKERADAVARLKKETDPQKIIKQAMVHEVLIYNLTPKYGNVMGYEEKMVAIQNPNTPTAFLLFLHHYPSERTQYSDGPEMRAPFVTEEIREAAIKEIAKRDWKLGDWERKNLPKKQ